MKRSFSLITALVMLFCSLQFSFAEESKALLPPAVAVGDRISFGKWEQDNKTKNGKEDIQWQVLAVEGGRALLVTVDGIDVQMYGESLREAGMCWKTSFLRKWMNGEFYAAAFTEEEKAVIRASSVKTEGVTTEDHVFALSVDEARKYFANASAMACKPSAYAKKQIKKKNSLDSKGYGVWWLRDIASTYNKASVHEFMETTYNEVAYVNQREGVVTHEGIPPIYTDGVMVRPAIWVKFKEEPAVSAPAPQAEPPKDLIKGTWEWPSRSNNYTFPGFEFGKYKELTRGYVGPNGSMGGAALDYLMYTEDSFNFAFHTEVNKSSAVKEFDQVEKELKKVYNYCNRPESKGSYYLSTTMLDAAISIAGGESYYVSYSYYYDPQASIGIEHYLHYTNGEYGHYIRYGAYNNAEPAESVPASPESAVKDSPGPHVGDYITFGAYEQDNKKSNGKEAIEWLVLAKENNRLLVISKYGLDRMPFNSKDKKITWEKCTLREWLNGKFLKAAFTAAEQDMIAVTTVPAHKNPIYSTNPGNDTQDKLFLLSIPEVKKYFSSDSAMKCKPTVYARKRSVYTDEDGYCWWWLRTPGDYQSHASTVAMGYGISAEGDRVYRNSNAVRPAMWIELDAVSVEVTSEVTPTPITLTTATPIPVSPSPTVQPQTKETAPSDPNVIYEKDGYQIKWLGFADDGNDFKLTLLVKNPLNKSVWFEIVLAAFNGIQFSMSNAFDYEIGAGMTLLTSTNNCWIFDKSALNLLGMKLEDISEVSMKFTIRDGAVLQGGKELVQKPSLSLLSKRNTHSIKLIAQGKFLRTYLALLSFRKKALWLREFPSQILQINFIQCSFLVKAYVLAACAISNHGRFPCMRAYIDDGKASGTSAAQLRLTVNAPHKGATSWASDVTHLFSLLFLVHRHQIASTVSMGFGWNLIG